MAVLAADAASVTGSGSGLLATVSWSQVDGVNVAWSPAPGKLRASLVFRVGKADERLPYNGITHLVEHLALYSLGQAPHYQNGSVRTSLTSFDTSGDETEVVTFLRKVCQGLGALPADRLEAEVRVVETEAARQHFGVQAALLTWRFGAAGPGLWGFDEYATRTVNAATLQSWTDQSFTRENAVLVLTGPPPADLSLPLASRGRLAVPALVPVLPQLPAWFVHRSNDVACSAVVRRTPGAVALAYAIQHRLTARLRYDLGVAYSPAVDYDPYDGELALLTVRADAHPEHLAQVTQVLVEVLAELARQGPTEELLTDYRAILRSQDESPERGAAGAFYEATHLIMSGSYESYAVVRERANALVAADVQQAAAEAARTLLYAVPPDVGIPQTAGAAPAPAWSTVGPFAGRELTRELDEQAQPGRLVLAAEGVTRDFGEGRVVSIAFTECAAVLRRPDGQRVMIAKDGLSITIEPNLWREGHAAVTSIDAATSAVAVTLPARADEDIPRVTRGTATPAAPVPSGTPAPKPPAAKPATPGLRESVAAILGLGLIFGGAGVLLVTALLGHASWWAMGAIVLGVTVLAKELGGD